MKKLLSEVQTSVFMEYQRAAAKFGPCNNSAHESYAVILEEFEEATSEADRFEYEFDGYWDAVKWNNPENQAEALKNMREFAIHTAAEWIQVAAMCYKAQQIPEVSP